MNNLSAESEFRYILTWFLEWSELQRDDFVPVVVEYLQDAPAECSTNGIINSISNVHINNRPMSLFQCRIKLFREWTPKWPDCLKHKLKEKIIEIDTKVGEKIANEMKSCNTLHLNGDCKDNIDDNIRVTENNGTFITAVEHQHEQPQSQSQQQHQSDTKSETTVDVGSDGGVEQTATNTVIVADVRPTVEVAVSNEVEQVQLQTLEHGDAVAATTATTVAPHHNIL